MSMSSCLTYLNIAWLSRHTKDLFTSVIGNCIGSTARTKEVCSSFIGPYDMIVHAQLVRQGVEIIVCFFDEVRPLICASSISKEACASEVVNGNIGAVNID